MLGAPGASFIGLPRTFALRSCNQTLSRTLAPYSHVLKFGRFLKQKIGTQKQNNNNRASNGRAVSASRSSRDEHHSNEEVRR